MRRWLTFGDYAVNNRDGVYVLSVDRSATPQALTFDVDVPKKDGIRYFHNKYTNTNITVTIGILGSTIAEAQAKKRKLLQNIIGSQKKLIFSDEANLYYNAQALDAVNYITKNNYIELTITFRAEPIKKDINVTEITFTNAQTKKLINNGNYKAYPNITISGTATNITISDSTYSMTVSSVTSTVHIDCEKQIIYTINSSNKMVNKMLDFSGNFMALEPGETEIAITGTSLNTTVKFTYNDCYLI